MHVLTSYALTMVYGYVYTCSATARNKQQPSRGTLFLLNPLSFKYWSVILKYLAFHFLPPLLDILIFQLVPTKSK